jgi:methyl-accepting chemotaxis protein
LAIRATESTEEIRRIISEIRSDTHNLVMGMEESTKLTSIGLDKVTETTRSTQEISLATRDQKKAADNMVKEMQAIEQGTKRFVMSTKEIAASTLDLSGVSEGLASTFRKK